jgi:hypothetical protein
MYRSVFATVLTLGVAMVTLVAGVAPAPSGAASHREAPLISRDPTADITDFFMFRSYEAGHEDNVVLIMDVIPGEEPSSGPNYWNFDPNVLYTFSIDNDADGRADDVKFEVRFRNEIRGVVNDLDLFLAYVALPSITALNGPGSEGLGLRQKYSVTMVRDGRREQLADNLIAVPSNVGPRTMPDYGALVQQGIYDVRHGIRVFAGQRDDPFYIDLGAVFDTLNLRAPGTDMLSGFNVHTIALEVPMNLLVDDRRAQAGASHDNGDGDNGSSSVLGAYASTSRRTTTVYRVTGGVRTSGDWVQVQRLANPLVNEAIIGTEDKNRWNAKDPADERAFLGYYTNPRLVTALEAVFGADAEPLVPLPDVLLKYQGQPRNARLSELLRLDVSVPPVPLGQQQPLTLLATPPDLAGWPNGRRPIDDVTDVAIRVIGGTNYLSASDSVNANDIPLPDTFPFLSTPWDGRNRVHTNP